MEKAFRLRQKRGMQAREGVLAGVDAHSGDDAIKALIVNLESSRERLERLGAHLAEAGIEYERVPGIRGSDLSRYAVQRVAPNWTRAITGDNRLGTLGCFLGHIKAWERVAEDDDGRVHLVLEDDAAPRSVLPRSLSALGLTPDFDICFVNTRMERLFADGEELPAKPTLYPAFEARNSRPAIQPATGGDAYLLTKSGAAKLLEVVDLVGPITHVDWFLFIVGITDEEAEKFREDDRAKKIFDKFRKRLDPARHVTFRSMALWPALMGPSRQDESNRRAENFGANQTRPDA